MTEISTRTIYVPSNELPAFAIQITTLAGSYMIWVGLTEGGLDDVHLAPQKGCLAHDWAVAMPSVSSSLPAPATSLFRSASSDVSLSMAQRLARRFKKQIFLSIDIPPSFLSHGQGPKLLLGVEGGVGKALRELETPQ